MYFIRFESKILSVTAVELASLKVDREASAWAFDTLALEEQALSPRYWIAVHIKHFKEPLVSPLKTQSTFTGFYSAERLMTQ
jgi:hypothetical protein